jgi:hypothetical protein
MSLESCIRKAGKAFNREDADAIRAIRDDMYVPGGPLTKEEANQAAIEEYIEILNDERAMIMTQISAAGGYLADPKLSPSKFAEQAGKNLEEATRKVPRKGAMRPPHETRVIDYKTGQQLPESFRKAAVKGEVLDPNIRIEISDERTYRSIEFMWPDFYNMHPQQILTIVKRFDEKAALGLAKSFNLVPRDTKVLDVRKINKARAADLYEELRGIDSEFHTPPKELKLGMSIQDQWFHGWAAEIILDWMKKNESLPLYYKVEDPFEREFVESNPEHPLAIATKYEKVMREAEQAKPGPLRKLVNKIVDAGDMTKEAVLAAVPQTKIPDFIKYGMDDVRRYTRTVKKMDAWMNKHIEGHHALAKTWLKFNQKFKDGAKLLGEFMHASTLAGVDVPAFQMPDAAALKKMNKQKRAMWAKRQADHKRLLPFWEKLDKMGERIMYQQFAYNPTRDTMEPRGPAVEVSEAQHIYLQVRDTYMNMRTSLMWNLEKRIRDTEADEASKAALIARLRKQFESGEITPYFPLSRFGKHAAAAYIKNDEGKWEPIGFIKRENRRERNDWVKEMRAKGFRVIPFEETATDLEMLNKIDPNFVANVTELLQDTTVVTEDPETGEPINTPGSSIQDEIWQMYLRTLPEISARNAYIHRIGRLGFTHDALRAFSDHTFHGVHQTAKLRFGHELSELLKDIEGNAQLLMQRGDHIRNWQEGHLPEGFEDATLHEVMFARIPEYADLYSKLKADAGVAGAAVHEPSHQQALEMILKEADVDGPWATPISEEMKRRHSYNMNPRSAPWSTKLTALGFFWFLSTSPAAGVLNLTQTPISAYPILRARFAGKGAGLALWKASGQYATAPTIDKMLDKLRGDERKAMTEFAQIGMFSKTRTRELMGLSEAGTAYSGRQEQILEIVGWIFHKTEEANRVVTALAAYRLSREKGRSHTEAVLEAEELVEMSHYDYTNTNRPRFMQGDMGRVVFLFRNYSLNMQYRLIRDFRDGVWRNDNIPKEARKEARSRLLGIIGMTTIFAGVSGWPLFWAAEMVANNLLGDDDDPFDTKTQMRKLVYDSTKDMLGEVWGQKTATAIMKGPWSAFTGADLSQRASLNNLWIREIPQQKWDDPEALMLHLMGELAGPIAGMGFNYAAGFRDIGAGHLDRATEKFSPKWLGDYMKALRYAQQGAQTYQRDMIVSPEEFTSVDLFLQAAGFTPTRLADRYEQNRAIKDMETQLRNRRSDLMNRLFMAWRLEDRATAREVLQDIAEWNKTNPRYPITPEGIMQSARQRAAYDARTIGGAAVEKRLQYLQQEQRFTAPPETQE